MTTTRKRKPRKREAMNVLKRQPPLELVRLFRENPQTPNGNVSTLYATMDRFYGHDTTRLFGWKVTRWK